jgi:hypothetical protein
MSLWTLIKLFAFVAVMAVMSACGMLAWHIAVEPMDGILAEIVPEPQSIVHRHEQPDAARFLEAGETSGIDPGERAYQKACELLALGKTSAASEKLTSIINLYPSSASGPAARRIIGDMNMDEILGDPSNENCITHRVKSGESLLGIVAKHDTSADMIMHLNSMMELKNLHPGDELVVMPLNFRLIVEPKRKTISIWRSGRFIREFSLAGSTPANLKKGTTTIRAKLASIDGKSYASHLPEYRAAEKILQLTAPPLAIRSWNNKQADPPSNAIVLLREDMEELALLTKPGNVVEFR